MAREESKAHGRPARSTSKTRKASRSGSRGRQPKAAKSPPSPAKKSPARKSSPARPASPTRRSASTSRGRSPTKKSTSPARGRSPTKKSASPKPRASSPAKKKTSSPARGRSATRKGTSPARGRSPAAKKTPPARPKTPTKKATPAPRRQSKSPARTRTPVGGASVVDGRSKAEAAHVDTPIPSRQTPNAVVSPMTQTTVRQRSSLLSGTPLNSVGKRESLFEGTATVFEKQKSSISFAEVPSGSLRASARIASMQAKEGEVASQGHTTAEARVQATKWNVLQRVKSFGWLPTLTALSLLVMVPAMAIALYLFCGKSQCTVSALPTLPKTLRAYLHWKIAIGYGVFLLFQALLQAIPVGRTVYGFPCKLFRQHVAYRYRLNGWLNLLGTVAACVLLTYYGFPVTVCYRYCFQILMTALAVSVVLAAALYVKGHFALKNHRNPAGNTGNILNDFVFGREIAPRFGQTYDLGVLVFRTGLMSWAVLLGSMIWYEYTQTGALNYNFAVSAFCMLFYILFGILDEEHYLSSVFITEEGVGYMSTAGFLAAMPFVGALPAKFLLEHKQVLPIYCLPGIVVIFLVGNLLMHFSHKRKYSFRRNWPDPTSRGQGLDYLTDKSGNRLLVSGTWGFVRHPNYLGDLLCILAFVLPCGFRHILPFYNLLASAVFLVIRTLSVERKCQERYGDLWRKYTERVKYRIVPYVF